MAESAYLGAIYPVAFNYTTPGYALCQGQQLNIAQNQALYAVIGVQYGGNATTVFNLPDLRGRSPLGMGAQPGGTNRMCGNVGGTETVTLTVANLPAHTHTATFTGTPSSGAVSGTANTTVNIPVGSATTGGSGSPSGTTVYLQGMTADVSGDIAVLSGPYTGTQPTTGPKLGNTATTSLSGASVSVTPQGTIAVANTGTNTAVNNMHPFLTINFLIAVQGLFPVRN